MRRTQAKHAKATPRGRVPRPTRRGRGGLLLGALAVLVAAIVAIPALSALAASTLTMSVEPAKDQASGTEVYEDTNYAATAYSDAATYTVTIKAPKGVALNTDKTTVSGTNGSVSWAEGSSWNPTSPAEEGETTYTRNVTVFSGTHTAIKVNATYTQGSDTTEETEELTSDQYITIDNVNPTVKIKMNQNTIGNDSEEGVDYFGENGLTATVTVTDSTFDPESSTIKDGKNEVLSAQWSSISGSADTWTATVGVDKVNSINVYASDLMGNSKELSYGEGSSTTDVDDTPLTGKTFKIDKTLPEVAISFEQNDT